jgi:hypothetical protein
MLFHNLHRIPSVCIKIHLRRVGNTQLRSPEIVWPNSRKRNGVRECTVHIWIRCTPDRIFNTFCYRVYNILSIFSLSSFMEMLTEMTADERLSEVTRRPEQWNSTSVIWVCNESLIYLFHFFKNIFSWICLQAERHVDKGLQPSFCYADLRNGQDGSMRITFCSRCCQTRNLLLNVAFGRF